jgi:WhiB family redox-sensing transcriptional regulator
MLAVRSTDKDHTTGTIPGRIPWTPDAPDLDALVFIPAWMSEGICGQAEPDAWFPEKERDGGDARLVRRICNGCPVRRQCAEYAIDERIPHGIWGGMSPNERSAERRARRRSGVAA